MLQPCVRYRRGTSFCFSKEVNAVLLVVPRAWIEKCVGGSLMKGQMGEKVSVNKLERDWKQSVVGVA